MNPILWLLIGLLLGWLIEWVIDWLYWRRRLRACREEVASLRARLAQYEQDDLEVIKGIGPVIAAQLRAAGITTFAQLGALRAEQLREIIGDLVQRLADEEDILAQARELARRKK